jgi:hypothetical protein
VTTPELGSENTALAARSLLERVTGIEPAQSAWESEPSGLSCAMSCEADCPRVTVRYRSLPGLMVRRLCGRVGCAARPARGLLQPALGRAGRASPQTHRHRGGSGPRRGRCSRADERGACHRATQVGIWRPLGQHPIVPAARRHRAPRAVHRHHRELPCLHWSQRCPATAEQLHPPMEQGAASGRNDRYPLSRPAAHRQHTGR